MRATVLDFCIINNRYHAPIRARTMSTLLSSPITPGHLPSSERVTELQAALTGVRARIAAASNSSRRTPTLVAVSKYKPLADVRACYDAGQRDFGENYAQELVEKAAVLPRDVRWHFIGTVQSNKAKTLAGRPLSLSLLPTHLPPFYYVLWLMGGTAPRYREPICRADAHEHQTRRRAQ